MFDANGTYNDAFVLMLVLSALALRLCMLLRRPAVPTW
jgi:hypothetical protein